MNWKDKNVLITGIGGFAGSYLAKELISRETNVYGLIRRRADGTIAKNIIDRGIAGEVNLIEGDLTDVTSLADALDHSEADYIFHLAAQSFVKDHSIILRKPRTLTAWGLPISWKPCGSKIQTQKLSSQDPVKNMG